MAWILRFFVKQLRWEVFVLTSTAGEGGYFNDGCQQWKELNFLVEQF